MPNVGQYVLLNTGIAYSGGDAEVPLVGNPGDNLTIAGSNLRIAY
jgi:hypothetical protein